MNPYENDYFERPALPVLERMNGLLWLLTCWSLYLFSLSLDAADAFCAACNRMTDWEPVDRFSRWLFGFAAFLLIALFLFNVGCKMGFIAAQVSPYDAMSATRPTTYYDTISRLEGTRR